MEDEDLLDCLLSAADEENFEAEPAKKIQDDPNFLKTTSKTQEKDFTSLVHTGDTDSSDDEGNRNYENAKYNDCGKDIKRLLSTSLSPLPTIKKTNDNKLLVSKKSEISEKKPEFKQDVYRDPVFGIRIVNPLISMTTLQSRMQDRDAVHLMHLKRYVEKLGPNNKDWVVAGVIVFKMQKTSQKGNKFAIWTISDLHGDLQTATIFLFGSAYKQLWKCTVGTVIGILNPSVLERKQGSKEEATLSVDNVQRVMIFGQSKDIGFCKSTKKNGEKCTSFVNTSRCEFCIYHVKQEYQKCSQRSELQSSFTGRGLNALRNKVLGKNEVFYAGKSYTAIQAGKSKKLIAKDQGRMSLLSGSGSITTNTLLKNKPAPKKKAAVRLEQSPNQRAKDLALLQKLGGGTELDLSKKNQFSATPSANVTLQASKTTALNVISKLKLAKATQNTETQKPDNTNNPNFLDENNLSDLEYDDENLITKAKETTAPKLKPTPLVEVKSTTAIETGFDIPLLSGFTGTKIDLNSPVSKKHVDRAKLNAITWVQRNGPIQKVDPNSLKKNRKRPLEPTTNSDAKKQKIEENSFFSDRFKKMMAAQSKHNDLLEIHDQEEQEKYFDKLERKEQMEEKMMTTYKVECKAVRCLKCKYTSFSAADICKTEKHPLKVTDGMKRFFKCGDCGNRTVTLDVIPTIACKTCGSGKWERSTMMKERKVTAAHSLSIRGGEQTFVNGNVTNANVNLLVPENDN